MTHPRAIPAILALLFAFHATGFGEAAVLCVSPDGHVSLEAKGAPCCGAQAGEETTPTAPLETAVVVAATIAGCGDCTDIPLAGVERSTSAPAESKPAVSGHPALLLAPPAWTADLGGSGERLAPNDPAPGRGPLSHIRSVILRR